jgi:hypothetical protein
MIDEVFSASDVIACPVILGVRLRPLSIWHVWALKAADSPFVEGKPYGIEDICKAVMLCSLTRNDYVALAASESALAALYGTIAGEYLAKDKEGRDEACKAFDDYRAACTVYPDFYAGEGVDPVRDRVRCPSEWHLVASLLDMRVCGTEAEAWDSPIARAHCWQAVLGERRGSKAYVDQRDRDDFKALEEAAHVDNQE